MSRHPDLGRTLTALVVWTVLQTGLLDAQLVFTDVSVTAGVVEAAGVNTESLAWGDYDNDGDPDLYLTHGDGSSADPNRLLRNDGGGIFTDVTATAGVGHTHWGASTSSRIS